MKEGGGQAVQWPVRDCGFLAAREGAAAQGPQPLQEGTVVEEELHY